MYVNQHLSRLLAMRERERERARVADVGIVRGKTRREFFGSAGEAQEKGRKKGEKVVEGNEI